MTSKIAELFKVKPVADAINYAGAAGSSVLNDIQVPTSAENVDLVVMVTMFPIMDAGE